MVSPFFLPSKTDYLLSDRPTHYRHHSLPLHLSKSSFVQCSCKFSRKKIFGLSLGCHPLDGVTWGPHLPFPPSDATDITVLCFHLLSDSSSVCYLRESIAKFTSVMWRVTITSLLNITANHYVLFLCWKIKRHQQNMVVLNLLFMKQMAISRSC